MTFTTEIDQLARDLSSVSMELDGLRSLVSGWVAGGTDPSFNYLVANQAKFNFMPMSYSYLSSTTFQSIPNATETALTFDRHVQYFGEPSITWSSALSSEIHVLGRPAEHAYMVWGAVSFQPNSSGRRVVTMVRPFGTTTAGDALISVATAPTDETVVTYANTWVVGRTHNLVELVEDYAALRLTQNSGAALESRFARFNIMRVY
mgnify:FL=1